MGSSILSSTNQVLGQGKDNKRSITERLLVDSGRLSRRLVIIITADLLIFSKSIFRFSWNGTHGSEEIRERSAGGAGQGYTFSLGCHTVKIFLHSGCEGVFSHWLVGKDHSGSHVGPINQEDFCWRYPWWVHLIYEDPLGCAIASSWNSAFNPRSNPATANQPACQLLVPALLEFLSHSRSLPLQRFSIPCTSN